MLHAHATWWAAAMTALTTMTVATGCGDGSGFEVAPSADETGAETEAKADAVAEVDADAHADADADASAETEGGADARLDGPCDAPVFCYVDADGDGYVVAPGAFAACGACPSGSLPIDPATALFDCDDLDPSVHPGATKFETTPYCVPGTSCAKKSFDYDCDGVETPEWTAIGGACATAGSGCSGDGWVGAAAAACGESVAWLTCTRDLLACKPTTDARVQACR
jgi:hypothetical protein